MKIKKYLNTSRLEPVPGILKSLGKFVICAIPLLFSNCASLPGPAITANASPQLLLQKFENDPNSAWRYVNPGNANMVLRADENYTILHAAAFQRNFPLVRALVENGANPGVRARWKYPAGGYSGYVRTPATVALMWGRQDIAKYLTDRSGENFEQIVAESNALTKRAYAEARTTGLAVMGVAAGMSAAANASVTPSQSGTSDADAAWMMDRNREAQSQGQAQPYPGM